MTKHHLNLKQVVLLAKLKYYLNHTLQTNYLLTWLISHSNLHASSYILLSSAVKGSSTMKYSTTSKRKGRTPTWYNPILRSSTTCIPMGFLNGWWVGQVATVAWESKGRVGSGKRPEGRVTTIWFWGCLPPCKKMKLKWVILYMVYIITNQPFWCWGFWGLQTAPDRLQVVAREDGSLLTPYLHQTLII